MEEKVTKDNRLFERLPNEILSNIFDKWSKDELVAFILANKQYAKLILKFLSGEKKSPLSSQEILGLAVSAGLLSLVKALLPENPKEASQILNRKNTAGHTLFHLALINGNKKLMQFLYEKGADITLVDAEGITTLGLALRSENNQEALEFFASKKETILSNGITLMHAVVRAGEEESIKWLLVQGVEIDIKDKDGQTPLHHAVKEGAVDRIELLSTMKADFNIQDEDGYTPLHIAVKHHRGELIELLVKKGSLVDAKTRFDETPLFYAVSDHQLEIVEKLLGQGANIDAPADSYDSPLSYVVCLYHYHQETFQMLLSNGASVTVSDRRGRTLLHLAVRSDNAAALSPLLDTKKLDVNAQDNKGNTPLHWAAASGNLAALQVLLARGADTTIRNHAEETPLHLLGTEGYHRRYNEFEKIIAELKKHNIALDAQDNKGNTPLHRAVSNGDLAIVRSLLKNDAKATITNKQGETPLQSLCRKMWSFEKPGNNSREIVEKLITYGAEINKKDGDGDTPLHKAIYNERTDLIQPLLDNGADIEAKTSYGETPLEFAIEKKNYQAAVYLLNNEAILSAKTAETIRSQIKRTAHKSNEWLMKLIVLVDAIEQKEKIQQKQAEERLNQIEEEKDEAEYYYTEEEDEEKERDRTEEEEDEMKEDKTTERNANSPRIKRKADTSSIPTAAATEVTIKSRLNAANSIPNLRRIAVAGMTFFTVGAKMAVNYYASQGEKPQPLSAKK